MYCIQCGVKLADTEDRCPLCLTRVCHPDIHRDPAEPFYPKGKAPSIPSGSKLPHIIVTAIFLLPVLITTLCNLQLSGRITWSGFVAGALLLAYSICVLPFWFRRPNPVIFVPCGFAATALYLLYIDLATGGSWFLSFAFPVTGGIGLIVTAVVTLVRYVRRGFLYIFGGAHIALGGMMLLIEFLLTVTFAMHFIGWSLYPLCVLLLLGGVQIFLAICRPARETMERKLFI